MSLMSLILTQRCLQGRRFGASKQLTMPTKHHNIWPWQEVLRQHHRPLLKPNTKAVQQCPLMDNNNPSSPPDRAALSKDISERSQSSVHRPVSGS